MKHLTTLYGMTQDEFYEILELAVKLKKMQKEGTSHEYLKNKVLAMIFTKSSTRTRVSFETGIMQLGGRGIFLSSNDIQLGRGETVYDTANVLSRYVDGIMIRTYKQSDVDDLAKYGSIPVINGLTDLLHPCQAIADLLTLYEERGTLKGLKFAYVGDGNNVAHSLMHACALAGTDIFVASPDGYTCDMTIVEEAREMAALTGAKIELVTDPHEAVKDSDAVYTDTWISMGQEDQKEKKVKEFVDYQVNANLFGYAKKNAIFLHCLPAYRGYEVTEEIIDGPASRIFDQAENRLHAQKAVMATLMGDK